MEYYDFNRCEFWLNASPNNTDPLQPSQQIVDRDQPL
jgi:hypothetical protein